MHIIKGTINIFTPFIQLHLCCWFRLFGFSRPWFSFFLSGLSWFLLIQHLFPVSFIRSVPLHSFHCGYLLFHWLDFHSTNLFLLGYFQLANIGFSSLCLPSSNLTLLTFIPFSFITINIFSKGKRTEKNIVMEGTNHSLHNVMEERNQRIRM